MGMADIFQPFVSQNVNVTTSSQAVELEFPPTLPHTVRIGIPAGGSDIFIRFGADNTIEADATTCMRVYAGQPPEIFRAPNNHSYIALIAATAGVNGVNITTGTGN
jgi:hypothetical protein